MLDHSGLKHGVHRAVAKDGTVAMLIVDADRRIVEFCIVGKREATGRASRRWLAPSLPVLAAEARARRIRELQKAGVPLYLASHIL